ncbi:hypothetical protein SARC_08138 [Sphaeroforma arctica JP610]|uniref:Uncharacterized protein n=1 Tax=Sphaeroforma arctica JP610 TaxID=667725 RepID=A0A0L0FRL9_9EUKA|nr:hypothetical protein SARC_08138 [Sphaeroforma arctica JP610]KNC79472.1 hypothetical protein SARC_08138 [Sphaeroforma arctica JP610]|eukprot:XP_014153374.1 hypothetical protein SARC_08138 [Sphaeroforma arctica JP610]
MLQEKQKRSLISLEIFQYIQLKEFNTDTLKEVIVSVFTAYSQQCTSKFGCFPTFDFDGQTPPLKFAEHGSSMQEYETAFETWQGQERTGKSLDSRGVPMKEDIKMVDVFILLEGNDR